MKSERLDRFREHPARYAVPWSMTLARPVLGHFTLREARKGNWNTSTKLLTAGLATDFEGTPARFLNATSKLGAIGDPIADGILRAQAAATFGPEMPVTARIIVGAEIVNLGLNFKIQKGRDKPLVPRSAKWGSAIQAVGAVLFSNGTENDNVGHRLAGKATMLAGTGLRVHTYVKEYRKVKAESKK